MITDDEETISLTPYGFLVPELGEDNAYVACDELWKYLCEHNLAIVAGVDSLRFVEVKELPRRSPAPSARTPRTSANGISGAAN